MSNDTNISWIEAVVGVSRRAKIDAKSFVNCLTNERSHAQAQLGNEEDMMEIAKSLYLGMWMLIVDAKTRKTRPDFTLHNNIRIIVVPSVTLHNSALNIW